MGFAVTILRILTVTLISVPFSKPVVD
jgi:hypothetical protein